ncbi:hypothetical protein [Sulfurimonas sp. HSL-1716]|uniref:hypothetical protein n=1 Tax=Hydrocurvibacter sulfurireducens TaxID=3131937 RepID=UPI0031F96B39
MQINSNIKQADLYKKYEEIKIKKQDEIKSSFSDLKSKLQKNSMSYSAVSIDVQSKIANNEKSTLDINQEDFQNFLKDIGYNGKNIASLSQEEAKKLVSEDGFFGIAQTADRIAGFVLNGAGNDEKLLRAGREGILQGFKEAEQIWGDKLPDISYKTIDKALEAIDKKMNELGFSLIDKNA